MHARSRVVIAGAGTGKTYALVEAYLEALEKYPAHQILAITFTQKAAAEMRARVMAKAQEKGLPIPGLLSAPICTFHALCAQVVGREWDEFEMLSPADDEKQSLELAQESVLQGLDTNFEAVGPLVARFGLQNLTQSLVDLLNQIREQGLQKIPPDLLFSKGGDLELIQQIQLAYDVFAASNLSPVAQQKLDAFKTAFEQFLAVDQKSEPAVAATFRGMREALKGRFGDDPLRGELLDSVLALGTLLCATWTKPDVQAIRMLLLDYEKRLDQTRRTTKRLSFLDLLVLAREILTERGSSYACVLVDEYQDTSPIQEQLVRLLTREAELFVVGDPKQSIYGFRGASADVFERVLGERENLQLSRRSQGAVVELVNLVAKATLPQFDETQELKALHPSRAQAGGILKHDWAQVVADWVKSDRYRPSDIVILVRRIKAAYGMVTQLNSLDIPARVMGGEGFYGRQEILDFAAALLVLLKPEDPLAKLTVMRSPFWEGTGDDLMDWQTQKLPALFGELKGQLGVLRLAEIVDRLLVESGYLQMMATWPEANQCFANVMKLRTQLIDVRENYEEAILSLWEKLDTLPKETLAEPFNDSDEVVRVMTLHQSKGLEFPVVILADLSSTQPSDAEFVLFEKSFGLAVNPKNRPIALCAPQSSEEKKKHPTPMDAVRQKLRADSENELPRLLYVGLTRAKDAVYVVDLDEPDRGPSLVRLIRRTRDLYPEDFDRLMPNKTDCILN